MSVRCQRQRILLMMALISTSLLTACGSDNVHFNDDPVITSVNDREDISPPAGREFHRLSHHSRNFFLKQLRWGLDPVPPGPAEDVNRLGEVPSSSWYENRISDLSPADVAAGPGGDDPGPEAYKPWSIIDMKTGGRNPGFLIEDTRGVRYIVKLDKLGTPVVATAAGAVAARLFWLCGYNVPDDRIVFFARRDLLISLELQEATLAGEKDGITDQIIDALLEKFVPSRANGDYRVLVSRFLPGRPVGGYGYRGTRKDDPNDIVPHQNRRSLRGLRVVAAWLNHVDLKIDNTLDLYTEEDGRHFLRHYLVDFDGCLGGYWAARQEQRIGYAYDMDMGEFWSGLVTFGVLKRPYEDFDEGPHPLIGLYEADVYDPATWRANYLNDQVLSCTPADAYWAANVLAQVTREHIAAAVGAARFEDETADEILTDILYRRWAKTVDWGLTRVTPVTGLDRLQLDTDGLTIQAENSLEHYGRESTLAFNVQVRDGNGRLVRERPTPV